ncbi:methionyl-tRNA formyltransferase [Limibacter armeniacum]|uniref:methionyl-tRNA formyltransferase n=1 Tax=Limibacter armeniacum TaxID=466084 RepID=UPI002FE55F9B
MKKELRIVFMGTPEFAVPSLEILINNGYNVVGVITAPDKPAGRGHKLNSSPVKAFAVANNLNVLQPKNLKDPAFQEELKSLNANLQIVVAFRMLPEAVWDMPEIGTFNLHASLLPKYRGAAPINWAIINGETETGVSTFFLKHEIDTGDIIMQDREPIHEDDNVGSLYTRLMARGSKLVLKTVQAIENDNYTLSSQPGETVEAPKIFKETCEIDLNKPTKQVYDFIRGLAPYPCAWTKIEGKVYKIYDAKKGQESDVTFEGDKEYVTDNKTYFYLNTADGYINIKEWQMEGKKRMKIEDFLRGKQF